MRKKLVAVLLFLFICCTLYSIGLNHIGSVGQNDDGSFYISFYDRGEKNGIIFILYPANDNSEQIIAKMIVEDDGFFYLLSPEGAITKETKSYTDFLVVLYETTKNAITYSTYHSDNDSWIDVINLHREYEGTQSFIDSVMNSIFYDKEIILTVSALDISQKELTIGTTVTRQYDFYGINSDEMYHAFIEYTIWYCLYSGWDDSSDNTADMFSFANKSRSILSSDCYSFRISFYPETTYLYDPVYMSFLVSIDGKKWSVRFVQRDITGKEVEGKYIYDGQIVTVCDYSSMVARKGYSYNDARQIVDEFLKMLSPIISDDDPIDYGEKEKDGYPCNYYVYQVEDSTLSYYFYNDSLIFIDGDGLTINTELYDSCKSDAFTFPSYFTVY